ETRVEVTKLPASAKLDALTQTIRWTATKADMPKATFELAIKQPGRHQTLGKSFTVDVVTGKPIAEPVAPAQSAVIETLLMIRQPARLAQANTDWPLERLLAV